MASVVTTIGVQVDFTRERESDTWCLQSKELIFTSPRTWAVDKNGARSLKSSYI